MAVHYENEHQDIVQWLDVESNVSIMMVIKALKQIPAGAPLLELQFLCSAMCLHASRSRPASPMPSSFESSAEVWRHPLRLSP